MKKIIPFVFVLVQLVQLYAIPFNSNVSEQEIEDAFNEKILIRNINSFKEAAIDTDIQEINDYLEVLKKLNPHYFVEVFQLRKIKPNDNIIQKVYGVLFDLESYVNIPYYSEYNKTTTPLYSYSKIIENTRTPNSVDFSAEMTMPPFECYVANISMKTNNKDFLIYTSLNETDMGVVGFIKVKKNGLRSLITVFQYEDYWVIYGIGVAKAPKIPFLLKRVEVAFINRVKAFCNYAIAFLD